MDQKLLETQPVPITREAVVYTLVFAALAFQLLATQDAFAILIIGAMVVFYLAVIFVIVYLRNKRTHYVIYSDRVERNVNWLTKSAGRMDAAKIESVSVANSLFGRDRYGRVVVTGSGGSKLLFGSVPNPEQFAATVRSIMNEGKPANVAKASAAASGDLASQLANLEQLRAQGVLDEAEFKKAKAKLLKG